MTIKLTAKRHFWIVLFIFLVACEKQTTTLPTENPLPTATSSSTTFPTLTPIPITITPSPLPTQPTISFITPNPIQVKDGRNMKMLWQEPMLNEGLSVLCEWEILGKSEMEVYVWASCKSMTPIGTTSEGKEIFLSSSTPAVVKSYNRWSRQECSDPRRRK